MFGFTQNQLHLAWASDFQILCVCGCVCVWGCNLWKWKQDVYASCNLHTCHRGTCFVPTVFFSFSFRRRLLLENDGGVGVILFSERNSLVRNNKVPVGLASDARTQTHATGVDRKWVLPVTIRNEWRSARSK